MTDDRVHGLLFGLALGDALGWPVEFMRLRGIKSLPGIRDTYGPHGIQEPPNPALFTDDTQMTIALTEGLLDAGLNAPIDDQMNAIGARFVEWLHHPENKRAPGNTCLAGARNFEAGQPWRTAGVAHSKGCGSAMRVATLGFLYQHNEARLREVAHYSGIITHGHPAAVSGSLAAAYLVKLALDDVPVDEYLPRTLAFVRAHHIEHRRGWLAEWRTSEDFEKRFAILPEVIGWDDEERAMAHLGAGWVAEEAVALALYCVLRYPDSYTAAVRRGANSDGHSDSIACIAGGIMGARLGLAAIPANWVARCEHRHALLDLAQRMMASRASLG